MNTQASLHENATDEPPRAGEIWNCIYKDIEREKCQTVGICRVVGVKSDGMLTQGI